MQCAFATQDCQMTLKNASMASTRSIPFHCSAIFSGDLNQTPLNGLERASGWNMSFYEVVNGVPSTIPYQAQANPFFFYAAAAVDSASFSDIRPTSTDGFEAGIVDGGQGRIAFAVSCNATIYDVQYSMINGNIARFKAVSSDPRKANIIQAPLQVGFGQYALFQAASSAASRAFISSSGAGSLEPLLDDVAKAFSEIGMAAASGAFTYDKNIQQRYRGDIEVTRVPFIPFWFLVVSCLLYSLSGIVMFAAAFVLHKHQPIRKKQLQLVPKPLPDLLPSTIFGIKWKTLKRSVNHSRKVPKKAEMNHKGNAADGPNDSAADVPDYSFDDAA